MVPRLARFAVITAFAAGLLPAAASGQLPAPPVAPLPGAPLPGLPDLFPGPGGEQPAPPPPRPDRPPPTPRNRCLNPPSGPAMLRGHVTFACDFPDPMVLRARGRYYAYGTATGWERGGATFPILVSSDLRRWRPIGDALINEPSWARGDLWAPHVLAARGRYFLYYSARRRADDVHCLAVATAMRPQGPFVDRGPLACHDRLSRGYIDPAALVHHGRTYLFFSVDRPRHTLSVLELRRDLLRARGPRRTVLGVRLPWQRSRVSETVEGPTPMRRGGRFYLFYSAGCWCLDYRMGYAVADDPMGPYRDGRGNPLLTGNPSLLAPGGGTVFQSARGRSWLAFHAWSGPPAYTRGGTRPLRVAPLAWQGGQPRVLIR
jgi:beta-xylosidase